MLGVSLMLSGLPRPVRAAILGAAAASLLSVGVAAAQLGNPDGPGQAVAAPSAQCPRTIACTYAEHNTLGPDESYRFQMLSVCGANCTTQYWISAIADGKALVEIPPVRGGGMIAVARGGDGGPPAIRTVLPGYGPNDPACCPSSYVEMTYTWDAGQGTLVASEPIGTPTGDGDGWAAAHEKLVQEGFFEVMGGP